MFILESCSFRGNFSFKFQACKYSPYASLETLQYQFSFADPVYTLRGLRVANLELR